MNLLISLPLKGFKSDSIVLDGVSRYQDKCPKELQCTMGEGVGELELRKLEFNIAPSLERLFAKDTSIVERYRIIDFAGKYGSSKCEYQKLLEMGMIDQRLIISLRSSEAYAFYRCSNALGIFKNQLKSNQIAHRISAVYGLQKMGARAVPFLFEALGSQDDSIRSYVDSVNSIVKVNNQTPTYFTGPQKTPEETEKMIKDSEKYKDTFHGLVMAAINDITGEKMDGDTTRIQGWISKQKFETATPTKKKKARKTR